MDIVERIWAGIKVDANGCWNWQKLLSPTGYALIGHEGFTWRGHRLTYTLFRGPIPEGLQACHRCDNPKCINPAHIFLGTTKDNLVDAAKKNRTAHSERNSKAKLTSEQVVEICQRYENGERVRDLVAVFGVSKSMVYYVLGGEYWTRTERKIPKPRKTGTPGTMSPKAKLNDEKVRAIRMLRGQNDRLRELAIEYGVRFDTLVHIACGRGWSHVA